LTVTLELDRVFICVAPGAPEADALAAEHEMLFDLRPALPLILRGMHTGTGVAS